MNDGFELPQLSLDGTWVTRCTASMAPLERVLSHLPGTYSLADARSDDQHEATGTGDDGDSDRGVFSCDAERAIVTYMDHWQAGLFAAVATYATDARYREALASASTSTEPDWRWA